MSHEIDLSTGEPAMMYAGEKLPWHGLGTQVLDAPTSEEALVAAGLNWEVKLGNLYGPRKTKVPDLRAIYRSDTGGVLGVASPRYRPFQNVEAFDFLDSLVADGVMTYETAGSLFDGKKVWILARMEEDWKVGDEDFASFLLLSTSHDAKDSLRIFTTEVRVVCHNTYQYAVGQNERSGGATIRIVHSPSMSRRLEQARDVLQVSTEATRRMRDLLSKAADIPIKPKVLTEVTDVLFGSLDNDTPAQRRKAIETFQAIYAEEVNHNGETAYTLLNTVTGYADHARRYQGESGVRATRRFNSILEPWGASHQFKQRGLTAMQAKIPAFAKAAQVS